MKFDKQFAEQYINKLLKKHKITVYAWSSTSCGRARIKSKMIKIPKPTNVDRFGVCLHEIFHIIGRKGSKSFEKEFYCDMYARRIIAELEYDTTDWDKRTKWHILSRIAMAHNRGLNHEKINSEIRDFFKEIDLNKWIGNKVFVGYKYQETLNPNDIKLTMSKTKKEVELFLNENGLSLEKSISDDSNYGMWKVKKLNEYHGLHFYNISDIVDYFKIK